MKKKKNRIIWEKRIKDYEDSGLTIKVWCESNQIKEHQFLYWRKKLNSKQEKPSPSLVPIDLNQTSKLINTDTAVKINVGSISLEVKKGFSPSLLKEVMKVLMEVC